MSRLILLRHAQATLSPDPARAFQDYDRLSDLGRAQAAALGEELLTSGVAFDRFYCGPAARHRETAEVVSSVYERAGAGLPEPVYCAELGEHQGARVVQNALDHPGYDPELTRLGVEGEDPLRGYLRAFRRVTRQWARGELPPALRVDESWRAFRARVEGALRGILDQTGRGETVGVVTSGGPIGSTVAWVMGLSDESALELAWVVENATVTELLSGGGRVSLKSFNVQPRMGRAELHTYV